jgi:hypothetical protein
MLIPIMWLFGMGYPQDIAASHAISIIQNPAHPHAEMGVHLESPSKTEIFCGPVFRIGPDGDPFAAKASGQFHTGPPAASAIRMFTKGSGAVRVACEMVAVDLDRIAMKRGQCRDHAKNVRAALGTERSDQEFG